MKPTQERRESRHSTSEAIEAGRFIKAISGSERSKETFQVFADNKNRSVCAKVVVGTLEENWNHLCGLNEGGAGVYLTVNLTDGEGRREENIVAIRAFWVDLDGSELKPVLEAPLTPHIVVETSEGRYHAYWLIDPIPINEENRPEWKQFFSNVQTWLAEHFEGDPSVKDLSRVMRVPGFFHRKGKPFLSRIVECLDQPRYKVPRFIREFGIQPQQETKEACHGAKTPDDGRTDYGEGERNDHLFRYCCQQVSRGLSRDEVHILAIAENEIRCDPPLDDKEVLRIVKSAQKYSKEHSLSGGKFDPSVYTAEILNRWDVINLYGTHYRYHKGVYQPWDDLVIEKTVLDWSNGTATVAQMENLVKRLEVETHADPDKVNPPGLLCLKDSIVNPETGERHDHTPGIPFTIQLPVTCREPPTPINHREQRCRRFMTFLKEVLPDPRQQSALWEIFGYCLTTDCRMEKGFILYGDGSNGKTVVLDVLRSLLKGYVSGLRLSDLNHTYRPSMLVDKLVNISGEGEAVEMVDDSIVKSIISGEPMPIERKYKDPVYIKPFAKLLIATNHLPRSRDKSHGYFRRWLILHFNQNITESKQDKLLAKKIITEELDEIFYGSLLGLQRLRKNEGFTVPESSKDILREYEEQVNPAVTFIDEYLQKGSSKEKEFLKDIYCQYKFWCRGQGHNQLSQPNLRREIEKRLSVKAIRLTGGKLGFKGLFLTECYWKITK